MSDSTPRSFTVALVGHPGAGKTALHAALNAQAGPNDVFTFVDLPGSHVLAPNTEDERQVYDRLLGRRPDLGVRPDALVVLTDATRLEQNLYFVSQVIDLRLPVVVALSKVDRARRLGITLNMVRLRDQLGVPVVVVRPDKGEGTDEIRSALEGEIARTGKPVRTHWRPSIALANAYNHLDEMWLSKHLPLHTGARLVEGLRLLSVANAVDEYEAHPASGLLMRTVEEAREKMESRGENWVMGETLQRHQWANHLAAHVTERGTPALSERGRQQLIETPRWVAWLLFAAAALILGLVGWWFAGG